MCLPENWIWLSEDKYPEYQRTRYNAFSSNAGVKYTVAEFKKEYSFDKKIASVHLRFSADTEFQLFCNDELVATGPATVEGDFISNDRPRNNHYATELEICPSSDALLFFARVKMMPIYICEYSKGRGGFMLSGRILFEDGTTDVISTDESWMVRRNGAYSAPFFFDTRIQPDEYSNAALIENIWNTSVAPLKIREEKEIFSLTNGGHISVAAGEEKQVVLDFDMIHAGFIHLKAEVSGVVEVNITCRELDDFKRVSREYFVLDRPCDYRGLQIHSVGNFVVEIKNMSECEANIDLSLIATYYPIDIEAKTRTNDSEINKILDVCAHTLKYCRQLHHLDSPNHCEPLACTGDYYIEGLMTAHSYADMSLAEFDVVRTAHLLRGNDGRMFHTTYSLIWVRMLLDVYMITGNIDLLYDCADALDMLLDRFSRYIGDNGLIENSPDYMFIDWIYIDGLSMHHPPKALGQTCLNIFYFGALDAAAKVYAYINNDEKSRECVTKRDAIRNAVNTHLFDSKKGIYFEGLNTETPDTLLYTYHPKNVKRRYYLKHSNILAAYFGICEKELAVSLIDKIMNDEIAGDYQPYFAHYLFEAIFNNGLCDKYTLELLEKWRAPVRDCPKGLVEGFIAPEPGYIFDHSHAWGGTPLYSLPKAFAGLKIIEPGMKHLEMTPSLIGLDEAHVEIPTPYGMITCDMKVGSSPTISAPTEIKLDIRA